jgi:transcriptional regulator with XRE-family HTH domain
MTDDQDRRALLSRRLVEARLAAGMTQVRVAAALEKHQSYVSKCEIGERRVDAIELAAFAELYGRPVGWFLESR